MVIASNVLQELNNDAQKQGKSSRKSETGFNISTVRLLRRPLVANEHSLLQCIASLNVAKSVICSLDIHSLLYL